VVNEWALLLGFSLVFFFTRCRLFLSNTSWFLTQVCLSTSFFPPFSIFVRLFACYFPSPATDQFVFFLLLLSFLNLAVSTLRWRPAFLNRHPSVFEQVSHSPYPQFPSPKNGSFPQSRPRIIKASSPMDQDHLLTISSKKSWDPPPPPPVGTSCIASLLIISNRPVR